MFKRCHSLKKSHINIKPQAKTILAKPPIQLSSADKENIAPSNTSSSYKLVTKVEMIKSIEWSGGKTVKM